MKSTLLLVALLTGCATWDHPTKSASAWDADLYECEVQAAPIRDMWRVAQVKDMCMKVKGWRPH